MYKLVYKLLCAFLQNSALRKVPGWCTVVRIFHIDFSQLFLPYLELRISSCVLALKEMCLNLTDNAKMYFLTMRDTKYYDKSFGRKQTGIWLSTGIHLFLFILNTTKKTYSVTYVNLVPWDTGTGTASLDAYGEN